MTEINQNDQKWLMLRRKVQEQEILAFINHVDKSIEYVLIKGWAASLYYDRPFERVSSDIDIAVNPDQYDVFAEWVAESKMNIDLHKGLRHLDTVDWKVLYSNSILEQIDDVPVRVLRAEDHLRVLAVHWLTDGGAYKQKLLDIYYLIKNRSAEFDWEQSLNVVSEIRKRWILITIGLAHKYFALDIDDLEFSARAREIPQWIFNTLEKEWSSDLRLQPIHRVLDNPRIFLKQLLKRFPPNAIQCAVECEGDFDKGKVYLFQIKSVLNRIVPSVLRITNKIRGKL